MASRSLRADQCGRFSLCWRIHNGRIFARPAARGPAVRRLQPAAYTDNVFRSIGRPDPEVSVISRNPGFSFFPHIHCGVLVVWVYCRPLCMGTLPSRKHLGRTLVRFEIALLLRTSSKKTFCIFDQKNGRLRL